MKTARSCAVLALLALAGCSQAADPAGDDDDMAGGDADADGDGDGDFGLLPCSSFTERDDAQVWERDFAYDEQGRLVIERIGSDFPSDGVIDDVRLELHAYGEHGVDTVTHDDGADCLPGYSFLYDHRGRRLQTDLAYTFDEHGNPLTAVGEHEDCTLDYDEHDNVVLEDCAVEVQWEDGDGTWHPETRVTTWTWVYDADGHELSLDRVQDDHDPEHWRWTWEDGRRVREETWQDHRTAGPEVVEWTYDDRGRLATETRDVDGDMDSVTTFSYACWQSGGPDPAALACTSFRESQGTYAAVSIGEAHACGLREDGTVACWGNVDSAPPVGTFTAIAAGLFVTCGLRADDAGLECLHLNTSADELAWTLPQGAFAAVDLAFDYGCALRQDGTLACWGTDAAPPDGAWASIELGPSTACALDAGGLATCWGGRGDVDAPPDQPFSRIAVGSRHGCGVTVDGELLCWGDAPDTDPGSYVDVAVGGESAPTTCALRMDGSLVCWGALTAPEGLFTALDMKSLAACALRDDERLVCWGDNSQNLTTPP